MHDGGRSCVTLGVRGIVKFAVRARGAAYPTHSGNWGGVAPNPAWRLVEVLNSMRTPDGHVLIDGFYDDVPPFSADVQAMMRAVPDDTAAMKRLYGLGSTDGAAQSLQEGLNLPAFSVHMMQGGEVGGVIAARATAEIA